MSRKSSTKRANFNRGYTTDKRRGSIYQSNEWPNKIKAAVGEIRKSFCSEYEKPEEWAKSIDYDLIFKKRKLNRML